MGKVIGGLWRAGGQAANLLFDTFLPGDPAQRLFNEGAELFDPITRIRQDRIRDFGVSSGEAFTPLDMPFGPRAVCDGVVAYIGPIKAVETEESSGKGGGSTEVQSFIYRTDVAIDFAEAPDGGVVEVTSVWADGQFVYGQNPDQDETSDEVSCTKVTAKGKTYLDITSPLGGPNLKKFKKNGSLVEMSGWATAGNNVDAPVVATKKNKSTGATTMRLLIADADASGVANEAAGSTVTLFQENVKSNLNELADVTFYLGTDSHVVDPALEADEGTGNTSAARGRVRMVISQMALNRWGNRVPMSWRAVVKAHSSLTLAQAVEKLCQKAGLTSDQYDVTGLSGSVQGFKLRAGESPWDVLVPLMLAYDVLASEVSGKLLFYHRADAEHVTVSADELGAHASDTEAQRELRMQRTAAISLPSEVRVSYLDPTKDLQQSDARQRGDSTASGPSVSYALPIVLDPEDARALAKRLLWLPRATRLSAGFSLPPSRQDVIPGDIVDVTAHGEAWQLLVQRVDSGANGVLQVEAIADNTGVVATAAAGAKDDASDSLAVPPALALEAMDLPAITEAHVLLPGIYLAPSLYDTDESWPGAVIYESADDGDSFVVAATTNEEATAGYVSSGTLSEAASPLAWDRGSSISVTIWNGELESVSELDALNYRNLAAVKTEGGWEVIVFRNATLTGTSALGHKTYTLDTFLRGVRGTEDQITGQEANAAFVLLTPSMFAQYLLATQGQSRVFRAVPSGGASSDFSDDVEATLGMRTLKPFAPALVEVDPPNLKTQDESLFIRWRRRTRAFVDPFAVIGTWSGGPSGAQAPLAEESDLFRVEVWIDGAVVRSEDVAGAGDEENEYEYTAAMQVSDGLDWLTTTTFEVLVYQMSSSVGPGVPLHAAPDSLIP